MVGMMRAELTTFWPPVKRANQAALHPDVPFSSASYQYSTFLWKVKQICCVFTGNRCFQWCKSWTGHAERIQHKQYTPRSPAPDVSRFIDLYLATHIIRIYSQKYRSRKRCHRQKHPRIIKSGGFLRKIRFFFDFSLIFPEIVVYLLNRTFRGVAQSGWSARFGT